MLLQFYDIALAALALAAYPFFRLHRRGSRRLIERYGDWKLSPGTYLWFHGASFGEVQGLIPLMRQVRKLNPNSKILLTATSTTGLERGAPFADEVRLMPFDAPTFIHRALSDVTISSFIFGETELWPGVLAYLEERKIPCALVNGRISDSSAKSYRMLRSLLSPVLQSLTAVCAQDIESAERLAALCNRKSVPVIGNIKFDHTPSIQSEQMRAAVRERFFPNSKKVLVLGSVHLEEGEIWFPAIQRMLSRYPEMCVVVAPRHPERFDQFEELLSKHGIAAHRHSKNVKNLESRVILLDTLGKLEETYSIADLAFVGGSLINLGGHNPLEACAYGVAVVMGPSVFNVRDIVRQLEHEQALQTVKDTADCETLIQAWLTDSKRFAAAGVCAARVATSFRGATERTLTELKNTGVLP